MTLVLLLQLFKCQFVVLQTFARVALEENVDNNDLYNGLSADPCLVLCQTEKMVFSPYKKITNFLQESILYNYNN